MQIVDTLIHARWIIPIEPHNSILEHQTIVVDQEKIIAIKPSTQAKHHYQSEQQFELSNHVLLPGLINTHTHSAMTLLRGLADDLPLMTWLNDHIWPAEKKLINEESIKIGSELALCEMIKSGTTCFNDHYFHPRITENACINTGMRSMLGLFIIDYPTACSKDANDCIKQATETLTETPSHPLISWAIAPHAPYSCSNQTLKKAKALADRYQLPIHIHTHETHTEIEESLKQHHMRPLERLKQLGWMENHVIHAHMTQLLTQEIELLQCHPHHIAHNPACNLKLASGFAPVQSLLEANINVAMATDGPASNNTLDMFEAIRISALAGKLHNHDPTAHKAIDMLRMATIHGAKALQLDHKIGSIEVGKLADLIAIDLNQPNTQPVHNVISQCVYAANSHQVTHSWVNGKILMKDRCLQTLNEHAVIENTNQYLNKKMQASK